MNSEAQNSQPHELPSSPADYYFPGQMHVGPHAGFAASQASPPSQSASFLPANPNLLPSFNASFGTPATPLAPRAYHGNQTTYSQFGTPHPLPAFSHGRPIHPFTPSQHANLTHGPLRNHVLPSVQTPTQQNGRGFSFDALENELNAPDELKPLPLNLEGQGDAQAPSKQQFSDAPVVAAKKGVISDEQRAAIGRTGASSSPRTQKSTKNSAKENDEGKGRGKKADADAKKSKPAKKNKGKGAKSGANAREAGKSDDEINEMGDSEKEEAGVKNDASRVQWSEDDKKKIVSYMTDPTRWEKITVKLSEFSAYLAQYVFEGRRNTEQVRQQWMYLFRKYKACKRRHNHTGGGDGDKDSVSIEGKTFTNTQLDTFEVTTIFEMIDKVAKDRVDVKRDTVISSCDPTSENEGDDEDDDEPKKSNSKKRSRDADEEVFELVGTCIKSLMSKQADGAKRDEENAKREARRLEMELEREEKRMKLEAERNERERAVEERKAREAKWAEYERASKFTSPAMVAYAARLEKELLG